MVGTASTTVDAISRHLTSPNATQSTHATRGASAHLRYQGSRPILAIIQLSFSHSNSCHWLVTMPPVSPLFWLYAHHSQPLAGTELYAAAPPCGVAATRGLRVVGSS